MSVESSQPTPPVQPAPEAASVSSQMFTSRQPAPEPISWTPWIIAAAVVLAIALALIVTHRSKPATINTLLPPAPYASSLAITTTPTSMSESTSLSGGKVMYIDGHIKNNGPSTLTYATVQIVFANDEAMPPQIETLPLTVIRTHEPYIDTQPISAAPIAPGEEREFRLIFESITPSWNGQIPQIHIVQTTQK